MANFKIAVIGGRESVMGFKALGLDVFAAEDPAEARQTFIRLVRDSQEYAIIYITERLSLNLKAEIEKIKDRPSPAVILIPDKEGSIGLGKAALKSAVERAVGADII